MLKFFLQGFFVLTLVFGGVAGGSYLYLGSFEGKPARNQNIFDDLSQRPLVIAHRGGAGIAPENTIEALASAEGGFDFRQAEGTKQVAEDAINCDAAKNEERQCDDFQSRRPIDVISANRPILILDEPQKMECWF